MINWTSYFSTAILERGKKYYKRGLVQNVEKLGEKYTAEVIGSVPYQVAVWKKAGHQLGMSCDCPYAMEGKKCKHMAALCMALEEEWGESALGAIAPKQVQKADKRVYPFPEKNKPNGRDYTYYDLSAMTKNFVFMESKVSAAQKLIKEEKIILREVRNGYYGQKLLGIADAAYQDGKIRSNVHLRFTQDEIVAVYCNVPRCSCYYENSGYYRKNELCQHGIAALLLLAEYIDQHNPGDSTDYEAMEIMAYYQRKHRSMVIGSVEEVQKDLVLVPRLEKKWNALMLSFKVGIEKTYVIKNLTEFVEHVEAGLEQQFGTKTTIHYAMHKVSEESEDYYRFVKKIVKEELYRRGSTQNSRVYDYVDNRIKGEIELYGHRLDEFFDLIRKKECPVAYADKVQGKGRNELLYFAEKTPKITLELQPNYNRNNIFTGVMVEGKVPEVLSGETYYYYLEGTSLNRISEAAVRELEPLLKLAMEDNIQFEIGRKSLPEFYYHTMPALREYVDFAEREGGVVERYLPPEAKFQFYLDVEKNDIICQAKVLYGEKEVSLTNHVEQGRPVNTDMIRDFNAEAEALFHVMRYFPYWDAGQETFLCEGKEEAAYTVLESGISELMLVGEVFCTERLKRISVRRKPKLSVGVSLESGIMNLQISSEEISGQELLDILTSYRKKKTYHRLKNGDFLNIEDENIEMLASMVDTLHISSKDFLKGNIKVPAYRALYLDKLLEKNESLYVERDKHFKQLIKEFKTVSDSEFEVPRSLQKVMRNYQTVGFRWLKMLDAYGFGGILADDMGLGKTLQVISVLQSAKEEKKEGVSLVISPASLIYNWQEEFARFAPGIRTMVVSGSQGERMKLLKDYQRYDVLITSYDLLKRDIAEYENKQFQFQIIDEAQYIKNHATAAAKAVKCITSKTRYALTGTPIENRLSELWSIFDYLMPGFLYSYEGFRRDLEQPIAKYKEEEAGKRLKKMVSPFILRRLKTDVLKDLPDKLEEIQYARFDAVQQKLYDGQVVHMKQMLEKQDAEDFRQNKIQVLAELTRLRQICCDPALFLENYNGESAKREACIHLIRSAIEGEHRILVFSQFTSMLALLEENLKQEQIAYYKITGSTPKEERVSLVKAFNEGQVPVFLISLKAGGTGLNLTGADIVIHYDPWWNQAVQNQATDRAHRIGQKKVVTVYRLIVKNTIEENIMKLQEAKKNLADEILRGENGGLAGLTKEELLELL